MKYEKKKLELGCGKYPNPEAVNVDIRQLAGVDVVHDLNVFPYPFEDQQFEDVKATDVVEHIGDVFKAMGEIHRIMVSGGILHIHTNYAGHIGSFTDPTHLHFFTLESFDYFDPDTFLGKEFGFYTERKFKILEKRINESGTGLYFEMQKI